MCSTPLENHLQACTPAKELLMLLTCWTTSLGGTGCSPALPSRKRILSCLQLFMLTYFACQRCSSCSRTSSCIPWKPENPHQGLMALLTCLLSNPTGRRLRNSLHSTTKGVTVIGLAAVLLLARSPKSLSRFCSNQMQLWIFVPMVTN